MICRIRKDRHLTVQPSFSSLGGWPDLLEKLRRLTPTPKHAAEMMHRLVEAHGVALPLRLHAALITVKRRKPLGEYQAWWPFVSMETWCRYLLDEYPHILLAGHDLGDSEGWGRDFREFWDKYRTVNPNHPVYSSGLDLGHCCPYAFHGDEGRGAARDPFLVCGFQPVLSHLGVGFCNDSSHLGL